MTSADTSGEPSPDAGSPADSAEIIAGALRTKFGKGALNIAEKQLDRASVETVAVWRDVVERLRP